MCVGGSFACETAQGRDRVAGGCAAAAAASTAKRPIVHTTRFRKQHTARRAIPPLTTPLQPKTSPSPAGDVGGEYFGHVSLQQARAVALEVGHAAHQPAPQPQQEVHTTCKGGNAKGSKSVHRQCRQEGHIQEGQRLHSSCSMQLPSTMRIASPLQKCVTLPLWL